MPHAFSIWLVIFEIAFPPAIDKIYNSFSLLEVSEELSLVFLPVIVHNDVVVCDWNLRRNQRIFNTFSVEFITIEITFVPNFIVVPIQKAMSMHPVVQPVPEIKLAISALVHTFTWPLESPFLNVFTNKNISSVVSNFVVPWDFHVVCQAQVILIV